MSFRRLKLPIFCKQKNKKSIEDAKVVLENSKAQIESLKNSKQSTANALKASQATKQQYVNELTDEQKAILTNNYLLISENNYISFETVYLRFKPSISLLASSCDFPTTFGI